MILPLCDRAKKVQKFVIPVCKVRTLLIADIQIKCPYDGCQAQFGYEQYDTHIDQCQFNLVTCSNCENQYPKSAKEDHLSNCLQTVKVELATKTSELELVKTELEQVKQTGFKYFADNVLAVKLKPAEPTAFDFQGYNSRNQYKYYSKNSAKEELTGTGLSNCVFAPN